MASINSEISSQLGVSAGPNIGAKFSNSFQKSLKETFSSSFEVSRTNTFEKEISFVSTFEFTGGDEKEGALVLPQYQMLVYDLHLTHIDFLEVEYLRQYFGLRKKRRKKPELSVGRFPQNLLNINLPLASILSWKLFRSPAVKWASERYEVLADPLEVTVEPPRLQVTPHVPTPVKPSLYQLSNAAFPTRWIKRKGDWTEEDLRAAELDEVKGKEAWWFQYGRNLSDVEIKEFL